MKPTNVLRRFGKGGGAPEHQSHQSAASPRPPVVLGQSVSNLAPAAHPLVPEPVRQQHMRGASVQSRVFSQTLRRTTRPFLSVWARTSGLPWPTGLVDNAARPLRPIEGTDHQPVRLQNCDAELVQGPGSTTEHVVLYLHGGAFLCCGLRTHRRLVSRISSVSRSSVLSVDYRMLPDYSISDAIDDGVDAYRWLLDAGYSADQIVIAGDSAGGYLSFAVPLALHRAGIPQPAGIAALSPLTEMDPFRKVHSRNAKRCSMFPRHAIPAFSKIAQSVDEVAMTRGQEPRVCPVDADLTAMPPALIQVGSEEILLSDAELMADRLAAAGVPCELQVWDKQPHVFQAFADVVPEGHKAIRELGRFIRSSRGALLAPVD